LSNILTQAEIDELLNALSTDNDEEAAAEKQKSPGEHKPYDFRKAYKFQKEQMRTLSIVFQTFGQLLANKLSVILRTSCECEVISVGELSFSEFCSSLPTPMVLSVLRLAPMHGSALLEISPETAYSMISRLLGGSAEAKKGKQFTEIELALIQHVVQQILPEFEGIEDTVIDIAKGASGVFQQPVRR